MDSDRVVQIVPCSAYTGWHRQQASHILGYLVLQDLERLVYIYTICLMKMNYVILESSDFQDPKYGKLLAVSCNELLMTQELISHILGVQM